MHQYIDISIPPNKKIPTIEAYKSLLHPKSIQDDFWLNQFGLVTSNTDDDLFVVQIDDKHFSLFPGPEFSPRLYRGQNNYYAECLPALFRKPMTQIKYLTDLLKQYEFSKLIVEHPVINFLHNWFIGGKRFKTDLMGLSAHYEFATPLMDVTRSKDIAMFFASCKKNHERNCYEPIINEDHEAVIYTIDLKALLESKPSDFHIIGFQALPRPDAQKAYSIFVGYDQNFNLLPFVTYKKFTITRKQSEKYFEMFDGGAKLFPDNIIDKWANRIHSSKVIDKNILEQSFRNHLIPTVWKNTFEVEEFLEKHGYLVREKNLSFCDEEIEEINNEWKENPRLTADRVKCRFVSESSRHLTPHQADGAPPRG